MKTLYEGMFILPKRLSDEELEETVADIRREIESCGGEMEGSVRLGKRAFARPMKKQDAGHYYVMDFRAEGEQIKVLTGRFKLKENVFRVQFVRKPKTDPAAAAPVGDAE